MPRPFWTRIHWMEPLYVCNQSFDTIMHFYLDRTQQTYYNKHVHKIASRLVIYPHQVTAVTVADPGFPIGWGVPSHCGGTDLRRGCFSVKTCENERIGFCWEGTHRRRPPLDLPMSKNLSPRFQATHIHSLQCLYRHLCDDELLFVRNVLFCMCKWLLFLTSQRQQRIQKFVWGGERPDDSRNLWHGTGIIDVTCGQRRVKGLFLCV